MAWEVVLGARAMTEYGGPEEGRSRQPTTEEGDVCLYSEVDEHVVNNSKSAPLEIATPRDLPPN